MSSVSLPSILDNWKGIPKEKGIVYKRSYESNIVGNVIRYAQLFLTFHNYNTENPPIQVCKDGILSLLWPILSLEIEDTRFLLAKNVVNGCERFCCLTI